MTYMETDMNTPSGKDPVLWETAQRRASFKYHLMSYAVMNGFFWIIWALTGSKFSHSGLPWPVWPMFGWGIGLLFHFLGAYVFPKNNLVEKEYEKLKNDKR
jgi:hypothetical protein